LFALIAVGGVTGGEGEQGHGQELPKADEAEVEGAMGEGVDLPADGHRAHLICQG
jgi:hypothetical protein